MSLNGNVNEEVLITTVNGGGDYTISPALNGS